VPPVEDPWNEDLADQSWNGRELGHSRRDVQTAVDEVGGGVDFALKVLFESSVHLLEFLNWKTCSAHFCRIEVANFCLELRSVVQGGRHGNYKDMRARGLSGEHLRE
jgi:hypothetical protein